MTGVSRDVLVTAARNDPKVDALAGWLFIDEVDELISAVVDVVLRTINEGEKQP